MPPVPPREEEVTSTDVPGTPVPATSSVQPVTVPTIETVGVPDPLPVPVAEEAAAAPVLEASSKTKLIAAGVLIVLLVAAGAAYWWFTKADPMAMVIGGKEYPSVVAYVNGVPVSVEDFKSSYDQAARIAAEQGFDPATDAAVAGEVEAQAVLVLINTVIMVEAAKAAGFTASEEAIDAEVANLELQLGGAEQLASAIASVGLDTAGMRADLAEQIIVNDFIASTPEWGAIAVTDEEVSAYYDLAATQMAEIPPLGEVAEQIKAQLRLEKEQLATETILERLRGEATIEMKF